MRLQVIVGGQYGSEAKGHVAAYLASKATGLTAIRVAGPNAGHSVIAADGVKWALQQIPVAAVTNPGALLCIAAGSEIDPEVLHREITALDAAGYEVSGRLVIDPEATVIEARHQETESAGLEHGSGGLTKSIGSTGKGVGAARADRLMRKATRWGDWPQRVPGIDTEDVAKFVAEARFFPADYVVQVEGTQGYGLGLHAGDYPYCTSSNCRAVDFLSMVGISPWMPGFQDPEVWVVARTYPIRVAGNSGPMPSGEITWDEIGVDEQTERTTVTRKIRRVANWDGDLVRRAVQANGGHPCVRVALTMVDYVWPDLTRSQGALSKEQTEWYLKIENEIGANVRLLGTSPSTMVEV